MHFNSVLAVSASLFALGLAADPLAFTSWPKDVQAGKPVTLTWAGAVPDQPVTLTLRKGNAGDLSDVEVITAQAKDGAFTWTPGDNVKEGETYAFQVSQGDQRNYSALLTAGPNVSSASNTQSGTSASNTQTGISASDMQTGASATGTSATSSSDATSSGSSTGATTDAPQTTGSSSKPLISSTASGTPSSSPASTTVVSSTITANGPLMTDDDTHGKKVETKESAQNAASSLTYSMEFIGGVLGLLVYLVQ